jgi:tellurite resistance protein TehA-like permease
MATVDERQLLTYLGPNWFASVMGTGIVATAAATLPVHVPGLRAFAQVVWLLAAVWMVVLIVTVGANWLRHPTVARSHARNPQMAHFYGAAPMALLTVGAGAILVGKDLIG